MPIKHRFIGSMNGFSMVFRGIKFLFGNAGTEIHRIQCSLFESVQCALDSAADRLGLDGGQFEWAIAIAHENDDPRV